MQPKFKDDVLVVRRELERRRDDLQSQATDLQGQLESVRRERQQELETAIKNILPDIRKSTIENLQNRLPAFFTAAIRREIGRADLEVPLWERLTFQSDQHLQAKNPRLHESLYSQLIAFVDKAQPTPEGFDGIASLDARIAELEVKRRTLADTLEKVLKQFAGVSALQKSAAQGSFARLKPRVVRAVSSSAQRARQVRQSPVYDSTVVDDGPDLIDTWLLLQLLTSGQSSQEEAPAVFYGGGGDFAGGGAQASFEEKRIELAADPDTNAEASDTHHTVSVVNVGADSQPSDEVLPAEASAVETGSPPAREDSRADAAVEFTPTENAELQQHEAAGSSNVS